MRGMPNSSGPTGPEHVSGSGQGDRAGGLNVLKQVAESESSSDSAAGLSLWDRAKALLSRSSDSDRLREAENDRTNPHSEDLRRSRERVEKTRDEVMRVLDEVGNQYLQIADLNINLKETVEAIRDGTVPKGMSEDKMQSIISQRDATEKLLQTARVEAVSVVGAFVIDLELRQRIISESLGAPNTETRKLDGEMEKMVELRQLLQKGIDDFHSKHPDLLYRDPGTI